MAAFLRLNVSGRQRLNRPNGSSARRSGNASSNRSSNNARVEAMGRSVTSDHHNRSRRHSAIQLSASRTRRYASNRWSGRRNSISASSRSNGSSNYSGSFRLSNSSANISSSSNLSGSKAAGEADRGGRHRNKARAKAREARN